MTTRHLAPFCVSYLERSAPPDSRELIAIAHKTEQAKARTQRAIHLRPWPLRACHLERILIQPAPPLKLEYPPVVPTRVLILVVAVVFAVFAVVRLLG